MNKQELRKYIRSLKASHSQEQLAFMSDEISNRLLENPMMRDAKVVLAFYPLPDEVSIISVIEFLVSQGKTVLLPQVVSDTEMIIREHHSSDDFREGAFGILEPTGQLFTDYESIDVALIPGVAFDRNGNRLGRGKGYYDRFIAKCYDKKCHDLKSHDKNKKKPYLVGVAFPFQIIDTVPCEVTDVAMNEVYF